MGWFWYITTLKKLVLASYQIEFSALGPTVIGAFALAKVIMLLDMTPIATPLDASHPIWVATLCKTLVYCAVSAPILFAERIWHVYRDTGTLGDAVSEAWAQVDLNVALARVITVGLVIGGYHLYHGIDRRLRLDKLSPMILSRR